MDFWGNLSGKNFWGNQEIISNIPHMPEPPGTQAAEPIYGSLPGTMCSLLGKEISENHFSSRCNCFSNQPIKNLKNFLCNSSIYAHSSACLHTRIIVYIFSPKDCFTYIPSLLFVCLFLYFSPPLLYKNPVFVFCLCVCLCTTFPEARRGHPAL